MALAYHLEAKSSHFTNDSDSLTTFTARYDAYISRFANFLWMMRVGSEIDKNFQLQWNLA